MFLRAGFNPKRRTVLRAYLASRGWWWSELVLFEGGDFAWLRRGQFIFWPETTPFGIVNLIGERTVSRNWTNMLPCSPWAPA